MIAIIIKLSQVVVCILKILKKILIKESMKKILIKNNLLLSKITQNKCSYLLGIGLSVFMRAKLRSVLPMPSGQKPGTL